MFAFRIRWIPENRTRGENLAKLSHCSTRSFEESDPASSSKQTLSEKPNCSRRPTTRFKRPGKAFSVWISEYANVLIRECNWRSSIIHHRPNEADPMRSVGGFEWLSQIQILDLRSNPWIQLPDRTLGSNSSILIFNTWIQLFDCKVFANWRCSSQIQLTANSKTWRSHFWSN